MVGPFFTDIFTGQLTNPNNNLCLKYVLFLDVLECFVPEFLVPEISRRSLVPGVTATDLSHIQKTESLFLITFCWALYLPKNRDP